MPTVNIVLPESLRRFALREAYSRGYLGAADYIRALIRADQMRGITTQQATNRDDEPYPAVEPDSLIRPTAAQVVRFDRRGTRQRQPGRTV